MQTGNEDSLQTDERNAQVAEHYDSFGEQFSENIHCQMCLTMRNTVRKYMNSKYAIVFTVRYSVCLFCEFYSRYSTENLILTM